MQEKCSLLMVYLTFGTRYRNQLFSATMSLFIKNGLAKFNFSKFSAIYDIRSYLYCMLMYLFHFLDLDVFYADVGACLARSSVKGTG